MWKHPLLEMKLGSYSNRLLNENEDLIWRLEGASKDSALNYDDCDN